MTRLNLKNSRKIILICNAISNKQMLRFTYHGVSRLVEPYVLGQHDKTSNYLVRGWECSKDDCVDDQPRKLYNIDKMEEISLVETFFNDDNSSDQKEDVQFARASWDLNINEGNAAASQTSELQHS